MSNINIKHILLDQDSYSITGGGTRETDAERTSKWLTSTWRVHGLQRQQNSMMAYLAALQFMCTTE